MAQILQVGAGYPGVAIDCGANGSVVLNNGPATIYYRDESPVSSATNDGSVVSGASATLSGTQFLISASGLSALVVTPSPLSTSGVDQTARDAAAAAQTTADAAQVADADLTTIAGLTATSDNFIQSKASAWASRTPAQAKTDLVLVKADVGLGNVDNTTDAGKPVSTAQQTALDLKAPLASPTFTGTPAAPTPAAGDNDTSVATTAFVAAAALTLPRMESFGGSTAASGFPGIVAALLGGASDVNQAVAGAIAHHHDVNGYLRALRYHPILRTAAPYLPSTAAAVIDFAGNDAAVLPMDSNPEPFKAAVRSMVAALRCSRWDQATAASIAYSGGFATVASTTKNSGASVKRSTTNGDTATITVPADFPGGKVPLRFIVDQGTTAGTVTVAVDGGSAVAFSPGLATPDATGGTGKSNAATYYTPSLAAGTHTIVVTLTSAARVDFNGWGIESSTAPLIVIPRRHLPVNYTAYTGSTHPVDATTFGAQRTAIAAVAAEFTDGFVISPDMEALAGAALRTTTDTDGWHLTAEGQALYAEQILTAMQAVTLTTTHRAKLAQVDRFEPFCSLTHSVALTIATASTGTVHSWDTEREDTHAMHDTAASNDVVTVLRPGIYELKACVRFVFHATGTRLLYLATPAGTFLVGTSFQAPTTSADAARINVAREYRFVAGDTISAYVAQTSGGNLDTVKLSAGFPEFTVRFVRP